MLFTVLGAFVDSFGLNRCTCSLVIESSRRAPHTWAAGYRDAVDAKTRQLAGEPLGVKRPETWDVIDELPCSIRLLPVPKGSAGFHNFGEYARPVAAAATESNAT